MCIRDSISVGTDLSVGTGGPSGAAAIRVGGAVVPVLEGELTLH